MGAGHLSRPDFGKTQMDSQNPMSEFYECFLKGLEQGKAFAVPGCYARFKPDFSRQIYREDMPEYCTYSSIAGEGAVCVLEPAEFVIGQFELSLTARGVPMAVFIQSADGHHRLAVRLLPPFGGVELAAGDFSSRARNRFAGSSPPFAACSKQARAFSTSFAVPMPCS